MPLKNKYHSKWNVSENQMSVQMECTPTIGMSLKVECHSFTQNEMSLKSKVTQN